MEHNMLIGSRVIKKHFKQDVFFFPYLIKLEFSPQMQECICLICMDAKTQKSPITGGVTFSLQC